MKQLSVGILFLFISLSPYGHASCLKHLQASIPVHTVSRSTPRDVRVVDINDAWNEPYVSSRYRGFIPQVLKHIRGDLRPGVAALLDELDVQASEGRLRNLTEWIGNVVHSRDANAMSFMCEAEYALFVIKQNPRYVVTFEPDGGFYQGDADDVARLGMRQKSIDLRISDIETGQLLALREIKSSSSRASLLHNMNDAYEKVRLVHHLQVPELMTDTPVEVGLVYFYDYDPNSKENPMWERDFYSIEASVKTFLAKLKRENPDAPSPFDTIAFIDFGSRRFFHAKRDEDSDFEFRDFALAGDAFVSLAPKITPAEALFLRSNSLRDHP